MQHPRTVSDVATVHVMVYRPGGHLVEYWTDSPDVLEESSRTQGCYVARGGKPQPVSTHPYWADHPGMDV